MILESIEPVPLIRHAIEENRVIRTKKYAKLSVVEKIQANCDMKATNIILPGSGKTLERRKEDMFDVYERFRANGNGSIQAYFIRFHKLVNDMKVTQIEGLLGLLSLGMDVP
nr:hypothetical protein [Tanacetum cinerariifolium]